MFVDQVSSAALFLDGILEHPKNNFGLFLFCQGFKIRSVKENIYLPGFVLCSGPAQIHSSLKILAHLLVHRSSKYLEK